MLAQLLEKRGLRSRVASHAATARAAIGNLDVSGVVTVCISYVTATGNPSHLRYLIRRLHGYLPSDVPVVIGFWPEGEAVLHDERPRTAMDADFYTGSLQEAVEKYQAALCEANVGDQPPVMVA